MLKKTTIILVLACITSFVRAGNTDSLNKKAIIVRLPLTSQIDPAARRMTNKAFELAKVKKADAIIIEMNTPGGLLNEADSIRTKLINSEIPVYVLIKPNAASAGALISIACNKIYMSNGSTIGAATVVTQDAQALPDKYQSYMRAMMRSTAEFRGRNPDIAEAMVDEKIELDSISPAGQVLTLTRSEAIKVGFCDGEAESIEEVLTKEGYTNYEIVEHKLTTMDKIIHFLINPFFHGILILVIIGGIYYELQSPGIGFPLAAAITAAILYFAPLYLEELAANWEILLFFAGLGLIALEIFVFPGFGVSGILGIVFVLVSLILSMVHNFYFDFTFTGGNELVKSLIVVLSSFTMGIIFIFTTGGSFIRSKLFQRLVLQETMSKVDYRLDQVNATVTEEKKLLGKQGFAQTDMHPSGKIIIDNEVYFAISEGEFISKVTAVVVIEDYYNKLVVRKKSGEQG